MIHVLLLASYLIARIYYKNTFIYLFFLNLTIALVIGFMIGVSGISSMETLGSYSLTILVCMFVDLSIKLFKN